jgi:hypothetical protein
MQRLQASNLAVEAGVALARWDGGFFPLFFYFLCGVFFVVRLLKTQPSCAAQRVPPCARS